MSMWLWWFAAKITGPCRSRRGARAPRRVDAREDRGRAAESRSAGWRGGARAPASDRFHDGKLDRLGRPATVARSPPARLERPRSCLEVGDGRRRANAPSSMRRLERVLERHHQLDALERAQPELVERRRRRRSSRPGAKRARSAAHVASLRAARRRRAAALPPRSHARSSRALQLPRALGARQLGSRARPARGADLLMIAELRVGLRARRRRRRRPASSTSTACTRSSRRPGGDAPTTAESRTPGMRVQRRARRPRERRSALPA